MLNLPNILTLSRIALLPLIILLLFLERHWGAAAAWSALALYAVTALTDYFDGYFARKLNQTSALGTFLDPISDKIFVASMLVAFVAFGRLPDLWMIPVLVILAREFLVSGMREYLGPFNVKLPVTKLAKWKTTLQMVSLGFLMIGPHLPYALGIGRLSLIAAAILTVITGAGYVRVGIDHMRKN